MYDNSPRPTLIYRLLSWMLFPGALLFTAFVALKYRSLEYLLQRLGFYTASKKSAIWCHCASVGEINTALPLLEQLIESGERLLVSTNTITGQQTLQKANLSNTVTIFFPLDYVHFARKLLRAHAPRIFLIFETELWPNILLEANKQSVPIAILNGRVSKKTLDAPQFLLINYQRILVSIKKIFASSEENRQRFISLGAKKDDTNVLDNLKFAFASRKKESFQNPLSFPYLLCASTHDNEEQLILKQWLHNKPTGLGLVIAMRHPQRVKEICKIMQNAGADYVLHSKRPSSISIDSIYIIDTLGELEPFIAFAKLVFMGGSLVPVGGHNVLEPAQLSKCILIGPHYQNFSNIVNELVSKQGILIVDDPEMLINKVIILNQNQNMRVKTEINAKNLVATKQNILNQYLKEAKEFIQIYS